jgi:DNA primase
MSFNALQFCEDHGLAYAERHKHVTRGWVGVPCPFCTGNPGFHGGFNPRRGYYKCWRCGWHPLTRVIATLLHVPYSTARKIEAKYTTGGAEFENEQLAAAPDVCHLPSTAPLSSAARQYLTGRGFDPERIENLWGVADGGHAGAYKFRLLAPVTYRGRIVSYTGRDYTGRQDPKYKSCRTEDEAIHHKNILYGGDEARGDKAIVVEGPTDCWRLGAGAVGVFGIEWTVPQAILLAGRYRRLFILFDREEQAQAQADELWMAVKSFRADLDGEILTLPGVKDPGDLSQKDADYLMKTLGFK